MVATIMMELRSIKELVKWSQNDTQQQNNAHLKTSPI